MVDIAFGGLAQIIRLSDAEAKRKPRSHDGANKHSRRLTTVPADSSNSALMGVASMLGVAATTRNMPRDFTFGDTAEVLGAYIATGHSVLGLGNASGTAAALGDLIVDGRTSHVALNAFAPAGARSEKDGNQFGQSLILDPVYPMGRR